MRSITAALLTLSLVVPLAACASESSGSATGLSTKPVTLRINWWGAEERQRRTQQVIQLFEKDHPKIIVEGDYKDWTSYWGGFSDGITGNDAPDVVQMDELYLSTYAARDMLADLNTLKKYLKTDNYDKSVLDTGMVGGMRYGQPVGVTTFAIVANTDLLAKYRIPVPNDSTWTWDDVKRIGLQVSQASGGKVSGLQTWGYDTSTLNIWARQAGASLYTDKGKVGIPARVLSSYWQYLLDITKSGAAPPAAVASQRAAGGVATSGIATNTSVFGAIWNTQLTALVKASGSTLKLLKIPSEAAAKSPSAYYKPSMYWSIAAHSKHPAEAAMLVDFLTNDSNAGWLLGTERGIPSNTKIRTQVVDQLPTTDIAAVDFLNNTKVGTTPQVTPKGASNIETILKRHTEDVLFERATPDKAADAFIKELQAEIDAA
jgi:pectin-derived oligosaccharide transport system substrate-binding protein